MRWILFVGILLTACDRNEPKGGSIPPQTTVDPAYGAIHALLVQKCLSCHTGSSAPHGVDLSNYSTVMSSQVVVPGNPEGSLLYKVVESGFMPPQGPRLTPDELHLIYQWIKRYGLTFGS